MPYHLTNLKTGYIYPRAFSTSHEARVYAMNEFPQGIQWEIVEK